MEAGTTARPAGAARGVHGHVVPAMASVSEQLDNDDATSRDRPANALADTQDFLAVYDAYVDYVWRTARRLGVREGAVEDVVQETFIVVHRRLPEKHIESLRGWIYGIVVGVVRGHWRTIRRRSPHDAPGIWLDPEDLADDRAHDPEGRTRRSEATRVLHALLAALDHDKREVFVLIELEELSAPEAAEALGISPNTVASRLRLARAEFEEAARRYRARDEWRLR